jgi:mannose-6-phosphate isomerase-like protein (cupin superfamily)
VHNEPRRQGRHASRSATERLRERAGGRHDRSEHVGPATGESSCKVEHVGLVLSGEAVVRMDAGREIVMRAGDFFYAPPGHDSWVVGDEPYVSLHILGSEDYGAAWPVLRA